MIALPSPRGLNPNLSRLLAYPGQLLANNQSAASVALICEGIASGLLLASTNAPEGDLVGSEDLSDAAAWFAKVSHACRGVTQ
jgi:hypothetical protein